MHTCAFLVFLLCCVVFGECKEYFLHRYQGASQEIHPPSNGKKAQGL